MRGRKDGRTKKMIAWTGWNVMGLKGENYVWQALYDWDNKDLHVDDFPQCDLAFHYLFNRFFFSFSHRNFNY